MKNDEMITFDKIISHVDKQYSYFMLGEKLYTQQGLTLDCACDTMGIEPVWFEQYSKAYLRGSSFRRIVNTHRIEEASEIWAVDREYSIRCMARDVGYRSPITFLFWFIYLKW